MSYHSLYQLYNNIMSTLHHQLLHHLPLADPLVMVISTITSLDALLLSIRPTDNGVMFSSIEYCDWLNDNNAPVDQYINNTTQLLTLLLPSSSFIVTSVASVLPLTTPQVEDGTLSVSLNDSSHSETPSLLMFMVNVSDVTFGGTTILEGLL